MFYVNKCNYLHCKAKNMWTLVAFFVSFCLFGGCFSWFEEILELQHTIIFQTNVLITLSQQFVFFLFQHHNAHCAQHQLTPNPFLLVCCERT